MFPRGRDCTEGMTIDWEMMGVIGQVNIIDGRTERVEGERVFISILESEIKEDVTHVVAAALSFQRKTHPS